MPCPASLNFHGSCLGNKVPFDYIRDSKMNSRINESELCKPAGAKPITKAAFFSSSFSYKFL
jgi:hypothetical protein